MSKLMPRYLLRSTVEQEMNLSGIGMGRPRINSKIKVPNSHLGPGLFSSGSGPPSYRSQPGLEECCVINDYLHDTPGLCDVG